MLLFEKTLHSRYRVLQGGKRKKANRRKMYKIKKNNKKPEQKKIVKTNESTVNKYTQLTKINRYNKTLLITRLQLYMVSVSCNWYTFYTHATLLLFYNYNTTLPFTLDWMIMLDVPLLLLCDMNIRVRPVPFLPRLGVFCSLF